MSVYDRQLETMDPVRLRQFQDERLRRLLRVLPANRFYAERFRAAGIDMERTQSIIGLGALPFTTKTDLSFEQQEYPPYGRLLTYPLEHYRYIHQTSGTTGRPLRWLDTQGDWETWMRSWTYVYRAAGVGKGDLVFCAFSFGPYISHWAAIDGARHSGALSLSGGGMNSEQRLRAMLDSGCSVLLCTPTYALHLAEVAGRFGFDLRNSAIRTTIHAGEPGASIPAVRERIETLWGARCFDHAGATEVGAWAFECEARTGSLHLNELEFVFEVIDPDTGEQIDEGVTGELVITTLTRTGMPVIRYRTGDLAQLTREPCPCGRTLARITAGVLGRADDMLIVRGVNLYPSTIDNIIRSVPAVIEYEVEIRRISGMDDLLVKMEVANPAQFPQVEQEVIGAFRSQLNIRVNVAQAPPGSLPRYELKARRYKRVSD